jgi:hypothetical protein
MSFNYAPKYSKHALSVIKNLKEFDEKDFVNWFLKSPHCVIGSNHITNYLITKKDDN